jgi:hypothetical protein
MAEEMKSEAEAILEQLPDAAEALRTDAPEEKAGRPEGEPEAPVETEVAEEEDAEKLNAEKLKAEAEAETETEDSDSQEGSKGVQKRIDKLTARAKEAEERAAKLEAQLEEAGKLEAPVAVPTPENKLADVNDEATLQERLQVARQVQRWCIENPEGGVVQGKDGKEVEIEAVQARRMLADATEMITEHIPARSRYLVEQAAFEKEARATYPDLFKQESDMAKAARNVIRMWGDVTRFPDWQLVVGDYLTGLTARTAAKEKTVETPPAKKAAAPLAPPVPKATAQKPKAGDKTATARDRVIEEAGTEASLVDYFASAMA